MQTFVMEFIRENTEDVVQTPGFLNLSRDRLKALIEDDNLGIDEIDLFKAVQAYVLLSSLLSAVRARPCCSTCVLCAAVRQVGQGRGEAHGQEREGSAQDPGGCDPAHPLPLHGSRRDRWRRLDEVRPWSMRTLQPFVAHFGSLIAALQPNAVPGAAAAALPVCFDRRREGVSVVQPVPRLFANRSPITLSLQARESFTIGFPSKPRDGGTITKESKILDKKHKKDFLR
jgi:hypothetical protein